MSHTVGCEDPDPHLQMNGKDGHRIESGSYIFGLSTLEPTYIALSEVTANFY